MNTTMAFAMYKPKAGKKEDLMKIVREHVPTLRKYGMVTERSNYIVESTGGVIIEVFEWESDKAKKAAHEHPAIAALWEKMYAVSTFAEMKDLPEADQMFPDFKIIKYPGWNN